MGEAAGFDEFVRAHATDLLRSATLLAIGRDRGEELFEPPVSVVAAGLGLAKAGSALSAAWCVTRESLGPARVPLPGSVRAAWPATSTRSFTVMA